MQREAVMAARQARKMDKAKEEEEVRQLMAEENILDDDEKVSFWLHVAGIHPLLYKPCVQRIDFGAYPFRTHSQYWMR